HVMRTRGCSSEASSCEHRIRDFGVRGAELRCTVAGMRRRTFMGLVGRASAAALVGPFMRRAHAQFGAFPSSASAVMLPDGVRAKRVLEVFLYGGLSPWETLYFVRNYGTPTDPQYPSTQYYAFASSNA